MDAPQRRSRPERLGAESGVSEHIQQLEKTLRAAESQGFIREDLWRVYDARLHLYLSDNNRVWVLGSIFIPLSLAGVAAVAAMDRPSVVQRALIGFASVLLIVVWNVLAEHHRAFQNRSEAWMKAIEEHFGLLSSTDSKAGLSPWVSKNPLTSNVRHARWTLVPAFALYWATVVIAWGR